MMKPHTEQWTVKDKTRLLLSIMEALAGDAHLSLEGDLHGFSVMAIPGASDAETPALRRNTSWPRQDFVVIPLEPATIKPVLSAIGGNVSRRILHVQIERSGKLEFGAYDRFHPGCVVFGPAVCRSLIGELVSQGILSPYPSPDVAPKKKGQE